MRVGVTGHRPQRLGGYSVDVTLRLGRLADESIAFLEPSAVALGMAQGWDMAVGWACVRAGVPFDAYLPFLGQEEKWPTRSQDNYHRLLAEAANVKVCPGVGYSPFVMQMRNEWIVNASDLMLSLYDGTGSGGTFNALHYSARCGVPIMNVWHMWAAGQP